MDNKDRHKFLGLLEDSLETYQVLLYAYIMMNNHFHLLIQTKKANCSEFMRHFNIRYTGWFNWRHERSGNLYQGRYHAYLVDADNYLLEVSRYVHLNPVRVKRMKTIPFQERWQKAVDYPWSSLSGYVDEQRVLEFVDYDAVLAMVSGRRSYRRFIRDALKRGLESPFKHVRSRMILGDRNFVSSVKRYLRRVSPREQPAYREMTAIVLEPEVVLGILRRCFGVRKEILEQRGSNGILRGIVAELLYKYCDITQVRIGQLLGGIDYMAVSLMRKRLRDKMTRNKVVRKKYDEFEAKIIASM
jgi:REP element-mobilizing transposase RayT